MFDQLQIHDRRERWLVGLADLALAPVRDIGRWRTRTTASPPRRVLLFRLERIGDLLVTLDAFAAVRSCLPHAELRLVVGSWNAGLARLIHAIDEVETLDVPWLSRNAGRQAPWTLPARIAGWRRQRFDLAINFEPDIRSNALVAATGALRRVGYASGGGGAFLTDALQYDRRVHVASNARRLVRYALGASTAACESAPTPVSLLRIPEGAHANAARLLAGRDHRGPLVGLNPGAGRAVKEWPAERFARTAADLADSEQATIVLLGSAAERPLGEEVRRHLRKDVRLLDLVGQAPLVDLAAVLTRLEVLVTGDTGPMHLAAAVGTPVVAIFGPTDPARYAPLISRSVVLHANLWCRPCHRTRRPPRRCRQGTPDCLNGVATEDVVAAVRSLRNGARSRST